jgi:hypothetical protein
MPFGLCNAPATFERLMEVALRGMLWTQCLVYIDDIIVYGRTFEDTLRNLSDVLDRVIQCGLTLKPKKCLLFREELLYLGFRVSGKGVRPDLAKVESVKAWAGPQNLTDLRRFMGFVNYHRRFLPNHAHVAAPLTKLTEKDQPYIWERPQEEAFQAIKKSLTTAPLLVHPRLDCPFVLDTDASAYGMGGVLSQDIDGEERVIAYASAALTRTQQNYCTTNRELLAALSMIKRFRHYLWGRKFTLRTDHSSLRWLMNYKDAEGMLARWIARLQQYDFDVQFRPGKLHLNADGLSRCTACKNPDCHGPYRTLESTSGSDIDVRAVGSGETQTVNHVSSTDSSTGNSSAQRQGPSQDPRYGPAVGWKKKETQATVPKPVPMAESDHLGNLIGPDPQNPDECKFLAQLDQAIEKQRWLETYTNVQLREAQETDPEIRPVILWIEAKENPSRDELAKHISSRKLYGPDERGFRWIHQLKC